MSIHIPTSYGNLTFKTKTLAEALALAKNKVGVDCTETNTTVLLDDPHDEWARVQELREANPYGLHGCNS